MGNTIHLTCEDVTNFEKIHEVQPERASEQSAKLILYVTETTNASVACACAWWRICNNATKT